MPNTYVALITETVAVATNSVTFSLTGISGYTDLVIVGAGTISASAPSTSIRFNGDTGSNYSYTYLTGDGSSATSSRASNQTSILTTYNGAVSSSPNANIIQIQNYANTTTNKTVLSRANQAQYGTDAIVGLWRSTAAITSITIIVGGTGFAVGSTFNLYGIANADQGAAKATGGMITEDSQYWYHTFGASSAFIPKQSLTCDVLVVAGGGGGGGTGPGGGGGGGAGGFRTSAGLSVTATTYNVTVGAGGPGGIGASNQAGTVGSNSIFDSITSTGGGYGGGNATHEGGAGGSGGGGGGGNSGTSPGGAASPSGQGSTGGNGTIGPPKAGGGGGGASAVGTNAVGSTAGVGGNGTSSSYSGLAVTYAGGGGGGSTGGTPGAGGTGGGGAGVLNSNGTAGTVNLGAGGGGGDYQSGADKNGGAGGSGIVIIRYSK